MLIYIDLLVGNEITFPFNLLSQVLRSFERSVADSLLLLACRFFLGVHMFVCLCVYEFFMCVGPGAIFYNNT